MTSSKFTNRTTSRGKYISPSKYVCIDCGVPLTKKNSHPSIWKTKHFRCKLCANKKAKEMYHA